MIVPKKSLGQNFLRDENIARKIVEQLSPQPDDLLLEIGPGTGALTSHLIGKAGSLVAVEIDPRAVEALRERFGHDLDVIQQDIRSVDPRSLAGKDRKRIRVVGNIPYYITSEILFWMIDHRSFFQDATVMMQADVARRLIASPRSKEYGILSVVTQCYGEPEILFRVSRNSFYPVPNVDSVVVRVAIRTDVPVHDEQLFRSIVRGTFGKRRKTLQNGLKFMGFTDQRLAEVDFDLSRRPEELSVAGFLELTGKLESMKEIVQQGKRKRSGTSS